MSNRKQDTKWRNKLKEIVKTKERKCFLCGKDFVSPYRQRYCGSRTKRTGCAYKTSLALRVLKQKRYNEKHPEKKVFWRNSSRKQKRIEVIKRDNNKCSICRISKKLKGFFDIDHKDGDISNNKIENLWLLCPNCHRIKTIKQLNKNKKS